MHVCPLTLTDWKPEPPYESWVAEVVSRNSELRMCILECGRFRTRGAALSISSQTIYVHIEPTIGGWYIRQKLQSRAIWNIIRRITKAPNLRYRPDPAAQIYLIFHPGQRYYSSKSKYLSHSTGLSADSGFA